MDIMPKSINMEKENLASGNNIESERNAEEKTTLLAGSRRQDSFAVLFFKR
jgi:hypothetical protein